MENDDSQPRNFRCRHIFTDGRRCGSPSLRKEAFCYHHHTTRRLTNSLDSRTTPCSTVHLSLLEDRPSIQVAISNVLTAIISQTIRLEEARVLLYGLQIACSNLPKPARLTTSDTVAEPTLDEVVVEVVDDAELGLIAPESDIEAPLRQKSAAEILLPLPRPASAKAASLPENDREHPLPEITSSDPQVDPGAEPRLDLGTYTLDLDASADQPAEQSAPPAKRARSGHKHPYKQQKRRPEPSLSRNTGDEISLQRLNVGSLPALGSLDHVELNSLTFLKALETARADRGVVSENILAILTADEPETLSIVKPLHCSLFHVFLGKTRLPCGSTWVHSRAVAEACLIPDRWLSLAPAESLRGEF